MYRHRLLGMGEAEATRAALRDLGSPHAIARDLGRVHTLPHAARAVLLAGVATLLGVRALAGVPVVRVGALPNDQNCRLLTPAEVQRMTAEQLGRYERTVNAQGGAKNFLAWCRQGQTKDNELLNVDDILTALRKAGVRIADQQELTPTTPLFVYSSSNSKVIEASFATTEYQGGRYIWKGLLLPFLKQATSLPLRLEGLRNPVVTVGPAKFQLGTAQAPVLTTDILASALLDAQRTGEVDLPTAMPFTPESSPRDPASPRLEIQGREGDVYVLVENAQRLSSNSQQPYTLSVRALHQGQVNFTDSISRGIRAVSSLAELELATQHKQKAALALKLDLNDLRNLKLTPVPASQVRVLPHP